MSNKRTLVRIIQDGMNEIDCIRKQYRLTRVQLFMIDHLIRNGFTDVFKTYIVEPDNLTEEGTRKNLIQLVQNGYLDKVGRGLWKLTPLAFKLHTEFYKSLRQRLHNPSRWK